MENLRRIIMITNASNFERQKNFVIAVHKTLQAIGGYVLYVVSNYGIFQDSEPNPHGEADIYKIIENTTFDGCIIEGNIGSHNILNDIAKMLKKQNVPFLTVNINTEGVPFLTLDSYNAGRELVEHLIEKHHCSKINLILSSTKEVVSMQAFDAYKDVLEKKGIAFDEKRIIYMPVSIQNGKSLYYTFRSRGIDDADAVFCVHDVLAIGYYLELERQGIQVPQDILLCSLNRSMNSGVFRPEITGADRMDSTLSAKACHLLIDMMDGKEIPMANYESGVVYYGESCGCLDKHTSGTEKWYQQLILNKVEAGSQISYIMQFNDALETVNSLDELGDNIRNMLLGIQCHEFFCCINQRYLKYINNAPDYEPLPKEKPYDDTMVALTGMTDRAGLVQNLAFPVEKIVPAVEEDGDIFILYPLRHKDLFYGYMAFLNEYFPIEIYNYRICHESICSGIENLHRQMILRNSIKELDELHMRDQMTGLYNRFAINRFSSDYIDAKNYSIAMLDMDGLKRINDDFGHLSGNHAICITADVIQEHVEENDLVVRYGGDEFQVLSHRLEPEYWDCVREKINACLANIRRQQQLPYHLGVSLGFAVSTKAAPLTFAEACEQADRAMYENKTLRKQKRTD